MPRPLPLRLLSGLLRRGPLLGLLLVVLCHRPSAAGQEGNSPPDLPPGGVRLDKSLTQRWQVGVEITAPPDGDCGGIYGTAPVPTDWPEQRVRLVAEDLSPEVGEVRYRTLDNGVRQMIVEIPRLPAGESAHALLTFEVTKFALLPPESPSAFRLAKVTRELRPYLVESPLIESRHNRIRNLAREITADVDEPWQKVETIYDWVRDHVEYENGPLKGALAALEDGSGDCEELTSLFIALCRASLIPARTVWVPGHCYPEFYLEDAEGRGHWLPCQAAGTRDFGGMPDFRPILQKGDNFRVPEKRQPQRYVAEFLKVKAVKGRGQPAVNFVRRLLPGEE